MIFVRNLFFDMKYIRCILFTLMMSLCCNMASAQLLSQETLKIARTLGLIGNYYVDSVNMKEITEKAIIGMLHDLDPHSSYIPADEAEETNEQLNGNFDGIGIQFNVLHDTIIVIETIPGGPSEKVGLKAGDRIVYIDSENVAGIKISTTDVRKRLMGPKGSKVNVRIARKDEKKLLDFTITRDKIPLESLEAAYMLTKDIGYFKFNKFAATSDDEFITAINKLKSQGMKNVVVDLRNNGGGIMTAATKMLNHFFSDKKMMVYMEGQNTPRQEYISSGTGDLSDANVVVLVNENSASASEIFSGAIQDWDRGVIVGRRTFGKGLVQGQFQLTDGSVIRLTVARYYTPTGRSIQSPYDDGYEKYIENYYKRFVDGELTSSENVNMPDSLKYNTLVNKRAVYGGGGIYPDVFVPVDTVGYSDYYGSLNRKGLFNSFVLDYADKNRDVIKSKFKTFADFKERFSFSDADIQEFIKMAEDAGVKYDEEQYLISKKQILMVLKALVANHLWQTNEYYMIINDFDTAVEAAIQVLSDKETYAKLLNGQ